MDLVGARANRVAAAPVFAAAPGPAVPAPPQTWLAADDYLLTCAEPNQAYFTALIGRRPKWPMSA